jgi:hypothetical protein
MEAGISGLQNSLHRKGKDPHRKTTEPEPSK